MIKDWFWKWVAKHILIRDIEKNESICHPKTLWGLSQEYLGSQNVRRDQWMRIECLANKIVERINEWDSRLVEIGKRLDLCERRVIHFWGRADAYAEAAYPAWSKAEYEKCLREEALYLTKRISELNGAIPKEELKNE